MAVIVVNYASAHLLETCLAGVAHDPSLQPIVVDNFTDEAQRTTVAGLALRHGWHFVPMERNAGFAGGVNAGFRMGRQLGCSVFMTLNPDAHADTHVFHALLKHSVREPRSLIAPIIVNPQGRTEFAGAYVDLKNGALHGNRGRLQAEGSVLRLEEIALQEERARWRGWVTGACVVLHRELLDRVGGLDESYFLYWEDVDLSYRSALAGGSLVVRTDLAVVHAEGGTQGARRGRAKSKLYYYFNTRNRLAFGARHLSRWTLLLWIATTPRQSWAILMRGGRRQLVHSAYPLLAAVRGSLAGAGVALRALLRRPKSDSFGMTGEQP